MEARKGGEGRAGSEGKLERGNYKVGEKSLKEEEEKDWIAKGWRKEQGRLIQRRDWRKRK